MYILLSFLNFIQIINFNFHFYSCFLYKQQGYESTMTFQKYFAAKSEMSKASKTRHKHDDIKDGVIEEKDDLDADAYPHALTNMKMNTDM